MPHSRNDAYARTLFRDRIRCIGRNRPFRINFSSPPSVREWWRSIENARVIRSLVPDKSVRDFLPYRPPLFAPRLANVDSPPLESLVLENAKLFTVYACSRTRVERTNVQGDGSLHVPRERERSVAGLRYEMGENARRRIR